jgi:hypothetical protein
MWPKRTNMETRGIITPIISFLCGGIESAQHLFLSCSTFDTLWSLVWSWIRFLAVNSHNLSDHFFQFTYSLRGRRRRQSFLTLIWLLCVWVMGTREIKGYLEAQNNPFLWYLTRSNFTNYNQYSFDSISYYFFPI